MILSRKYKGKKAIFNKWFNSCELLDFSKVKGFCSDFKQKI